MSKYRPDWDDLPFTPYSVYPPVEPHESEKYYYGPKSDLWKQEMSDRMTGEGNPQWGNPTSQKQKDAVFKAMKGKKKWYKVTVPETALFGADNPRARKVTVDGVTYPTLKAAAEATGVNRSTLAYRLRTRES
jgi:hypothetical protein